MISKKFKGDDYIFVFNPDKSNGDVVLDKIGYNRNTEQILELSTKFALLKG